MKRAADLRLTHNDELYLDVGGRANYPVLRTEVLPVHFIDRYNHTPYYRQYWEDLEFEFYYPADKLDELQSKLQRGQFEVELKIGTGTWHMGGFVKQIAWNSAWPDEGIVFIEITMKLDGSMERTEAIAQPVDHIELHMQVEPATVTAEIPDILHGAVIQVSPENITRAPSRPHD